jgi:hypothetical protein
VRRGSEEDEKLGPKRLIPRVSGIFPTFDTNGNANFRRGFHRSAEVKQWHVKHSMGCVAPIGRLSMIYVGTRRKRALLVIVDDAAALSTDRSPNRPCSVYFFGFVSA